MRAAAKLLGKAKRVLIVAGGGAQDASPEVTQLSRLLQAPVLAYRRGRGVLDGRNPFSVTLPLGHELWGEADAVLAVGTRLLNPMTPWGIDNKLQIVRVDADREEPARLHKPKVALIGDAAPILRHLIDELAKYNTQRAPRRDEMLERQAKLRQRLAQARAATRLPRRHPRRIAGGRHLCRRRDADRLCRPPGLPGLQAAHVSLARLSGQSRLGLCHRARRATCAARRAGALDQRRRRLPLHRQRTRHRHAPPHSAGGRRVRRRRLRQCAAHPGGAVRQPADRLRPRQPRFRQIRRKLRRRRPARAQPAGTGRRAAGRLCPARADADRGAGRADALALGIHPDAPR